VQGKFTHSFVKHILSTSFVVDDTPDALVNTFTACIQASKWRGKGHLKQELQSLLRKLRINEGDGVARL
jgi:hypothetical protein